MADEQTDRRVFLKRAVIGTGIGAAAGAGAIVAMRGCAGNVKQPVGSSDGHVLVQDVIVKVKTEEIFDQYNTLNTAALKRANPDIAKRNENPALEEAFERLWGKEGYKKIREYDCYQDMLGKEPINVVEINLPMMRKHERPSKLKEIELHPDKIKLTYKDKDEPFVIPIKLEAEKPVTLFRINNEYARPFDIKVVNPEGSNHKIGIDIQYACQDYPPGKQHTERQAIGLDVAEAKGDTVVFLGIGKRQETLAPPFLPKIVIKGMEPNKARLTEAEDTYKKIIESPTNERRIIADYDNVKIVGRMPVFEIGVMSRGKEINPPPLNGYEREISELIHKKEQQGKDR